MRRLIVVAVASCSLLALGSAAALARHERVHHHHARHHARHLRHHFRRHDERFGPAPTSTAPASQDAGTVAGLTGDVLTIKLNDGTLVSGTVTNDTEIECPGMDNDIARDGGPGPSGGDNGGSGSGDNGDQGDVNDQGDDNGDQGDDAQNCGMAALTVGASVRDARLTITNAGAIWDRVDLES